MQLKSFRVKMYKCIIDSAEIAVGPLAVLVGKNESGKTALLKALHKFNPALAEPYNLNVEWPRGHRESRSNDHVVCSAEFGLDDEERAQLNLAPDAPDCSTVRIGRTYAGALRLESPDSLPSEAQQQVLSRIPRFVYMDEYQVFRGTAFLDQALQRVKQKNPLPEDRAVLTILALAGLDLEQQVTAAVAPDRTDRQYDLSDGSATITKRMAEHWKQMAYEVRLEADGNQFFTFVKAPDDKALIKLEERSRGFQWFFSFDAKLLHETNGELRDCVILLDEPGLHLHASAQRDLLIRLEEYAAGNMMIYTTHLPFMINLHEPERIRVINDTPQGTVVTESLTESSPDAKLTLQAALGMTGRFGMPVGDKNLVVEGAHDYWIVTALSDLLARAGKATLPPDTVITAAGGASEVTYLSTFMVGQDLHVVAVYDSDQEGRVAKDKFVKSWLTRYKDGRAEAILLGEAAGLGTDAAIEDLFPEDWYKKYVLDIYGKDLPAGAQGALELPQGGSLARRVEGALAAHSIRFNKGSVAKRICGDIRKMKSLSDLPREAAKRAEQLVTALTAALDQAGRPRTAEVARVVELKPFGQSLPTAPAKN